jgi:hypothetical protein
MVAPIKAKYFFGAVLQRTNITALPIKKNNPTAMLTLIVSLSILIMLSE